MNQKWNETMRACREKHGYLQKELANKLGISERTLQRYEAGESEPTLSVLLKLSHLYDTSIDNIIGNDHLANFDITKIEKHLKEIEATCNILRSEMYESEEKKLI